MPFYFDRQLIWEQYYTFHSLLSKAAEVAQEVNDKLYDENGIITTAITTTFTTTFTTATTVHQLSVPSF